MSLDEETPVERPGIGEDRRRAAYQQAAGEVWFRRFTLVEESARGMSEDLFRGDDPDPDEVEALRQELAELRRTLEDVLAPAAGLEPWSGSLPSMPRRAAREHYFPEAEDAAEVVAEE